MGIRYRRASPARRCRFSPLRLTPSGLWPSVIEQGLDPVHVHAGVEIGGDGQDLGPLAVGRQPDTVVDRPLEQDPPARREKQAAQEIHPLLGAGGEENLLLRTADAPQGHQLDDPRLERLVRKPVLEGRGVRPQHAGRLLGERLAGEQLGRRQADGEREDTGPRGQLHDFAQGHRPHTTPWIF
jgi:hypothetical protein